MYVAHLVKENNGLNQRKRYHFRFLIDSSKLFIVGIVTKRKGLGLRKQICCTIHILAR